MTTRQSRAYIKVFALQKRLALDFRRRAEARWEKSPTITRSKKLSTFGDGCQGTK